MSIFLRAVSRLSHLLVLTALVAPLPAMAATKPPRPVAATTDIIPLPLNPVLPAGQRLCAAKTASGLGYTMLRPAEGTRPAEADFALVNYIGYLAATGAVFDQGVKSAFPVNGVIPGFSEGLQMIAKTGIARFCIPATMGYGDQASGPIPANSDLVFQVELIDFKTPAELEAMRQPADSEPATPAATAEPAKQ